jgi:hypothetical protein
VKILLPVAWAAWAGAIITVLYFLVLIATERSSSPEASRGLGVGLTLFLFLILGAIGLGLRWSAQRGSLAGTLVITAILIYPLFAAVASGALRSRNEKLVDADIPKQGDFPDPQAKPIAAAINAGDAAGLRTHLTGKPDVNAKDRAGDTLLLYAMGRVRFNNGSLECVQLLLAAGADPNLPDPAGWPPLMAAGDSPGIVRALVEAGADMEALGGGLPAVVHFTSDRHWDSAIYLVEKGARLDTKSVEGLSLDYYLKDWKDSVYGEHAEGWDRLRAAIAKARRKVPV